MVPSSAGRTNVRCRAGLHPALSHEALNQSPWSGFSNRAAHRLAEGLTSSNDCVRPRPYSNDVRLITCRSLRRFPRQDRTQTDDRPKNLGTQLKREMRANTSGTTCSTTICGTATKAGKASWSTERAPSASRSTSSFTTAIFAVSVQLQWHQCSPNRERRRVHPASCL